MRPGLFLIGLITFVFNLGGGVIAPAVALYARSLGGDYQDLGLIGARYGLAFALLTIPLGRAFDRFGRRVLLLLSALAVGRAAALDAVSTAVTTTVTRLPGGEPRHARGQGVLASGTAFVYVFGLGTVLAFLPAYAADRGLSPRGVGLLLGGYWTGRVAGSLAADRVSDALGRRAVLVPAMVIAGVAGLLTAAPATVALLVLGTLGLGLTAGASTPTCVGLIADHVAPASRGMAIGLFEASCGGSILTAGLVGGAAAQQTGAASPYVVVAGLALAWSPVLARRLSPRAPAGG
jgi:MFS family permease